MNFKKIRLNAICGFMSVLTVLGVMFAQPVFCADTSKKSPCLNCEYLSKKKQPKIIKRVLEFADIVSLCCLGALGITLGGAISSGKRNLEDRKDDYTDFFDLKEIEEAIYSENLESATITAIALVISFRVAYEIGAVNFEKSENKESIYDYAFNHIYKNPRFEKIQERTKETFGFFINRINIDSDEETIAFDINLDRDKLIRNIVLNENFGEFEYLRKDALIGKILEFYMCRKIELKQEAQKQIK